MALIQRFEVENRKHLVEPGSAAILPRLTK